MDSQEKQHLLGFASTSGNMYVLVTLTTLSLTKVMILYPLS